MIASASDRSTQVLLEKVQRFLQTTIKKLGNCPHIIKSIQSMAIVQGNKPHMVTYIRISKAM